MLVKLQLEAPLGIVITLGLITPIPYALGRRCIYRRVYRRAAAVVRAMASAVRPLKNDVANVKGLIIPSALNNHSCSLTEKRTPYKRQFLVQLKARVPLSSEVAKR